MALTQDQITAKNFKEFYQQIYPYLNGAAHAGFTPVGTVISVMGNAAPQNYLACNGQVVNIADYPELAAYFTAQFGAVDNFGGNGTTTFGIPDLRGEFLRGTGTNSHTNQGDGANVGVHQNATDIPLIGSATSNEKGVYAITKSSATAPQNMDASNTSGSLGVTVKSTTSGWSDTGDVYYNARPTNTSVLYCIATKDIYVDARYDYRLTEKVVGTWIDGKPLYQKTVEVTTPSSATPVAISTGITNIDTVIESSGFLKTSTQNIPLITSWVSPGGTGILSNITNGALSLVIYVANSEWFSKPGYITIRYTKTTD